MKTFFLLRKLQKFYPCIECHGFLSFTLKCLLKIGSDKEQGARLVMQTSTTSPVTIHCFSEVIAKQISTGKVHKDLSKWADWIYHE